MLIYYTSNVNDHKLGVILIIFTIITLPPIHYEFNYAWIVRTALGK